MKVKAYVVQFRNEKKKWEDVYEFNDKEDAEKCLAWYEKRCLDYKYRLVTRCVINF